MAAVILRRLFASEFQEFYTAVSDKRVSHPFTQTLEWFQ